MNDRTRKLSIQMQLAASLHAHALSKFPPEFMEIIRAKQNAGGYFTVPEKEQIVIQFGGEWLAKAIIIWPHLFGQFKNAQHLSALYEVLGLLSSFGNSWVLAGVEGGLLQMEEYERQLKNFKDFVRYTMRVLPGSMQAYLGECCVRVSTYEQSTKLPPAVIFDHIHKGLIPTIEELVPDSEVPPIDPSGLASDPGFKE